jgi:hypothetical protein
VSQFEWLWGALAAAGISAIVAIAQTAFTRSVKVEVMQGLQAVEAKAIAAEKATAARIVTLEKDLIQNYVRTSVLDEFRKDQRRTLTQITNIRLLLARHFGETSALVQDDNNDEG